MKRCSSCKEEKLLDDFHTRKSSKDGKNYICKSCKSIVDKEYHTKNRDKLLGRHREYYQKNKDSLIAYQHEYSTNNKDKIRSRKKEYYQKNKEYIKAHVKEYRHNNPELMKERDRLKYENNKERYFEYARRRDALKRGASQTEKIPSNIKDILKEQQNDLCGICDNVVEENQVSHIDHIIPLSRGGSHTMDNLQYAHAGCNLSKGNKLPEE